MEVFYLLSKLKVNVRKIYFKFLCTVFLEEGKNRVPVAGFLTLPYHYATNTHKSPYQLKQNESFCEGELW